MDLRIAGAWARVDLNEWAIAPAREFDAAGRLFDRPKEWERFGFSG